MAKRSKGEKIELLYTKPKNTKTSKTTPRKKVDNKKKKLPKKEIINLDNEIVIGFTPKKDIPKKQNKKTKKSNPKTENNRNKSKVVKEKKQKQHKQINKKSAIKIKIIKWTSLIILILVVIIFFLLSSVFNIKQIIVSNNNKVSEEEIINLSGLNLNNNMFKVLNKTIRTKIKQNAYIEDVKIRKKLNGTIHLEIQERQATYILLYEGYYMYINNQGYILEISDIKPELPIIIGYKTLMNNVKSGDRLDIKDLQKLDTIIKIMDFAKNKNIDKLITSIDISDKDEFILRIESEGKTVYFGDNTNINEKILWILKLLEEEKGYEGDMLIQDIHKVYFKEKV